MTRRSTPVAASARRSPRPSTPLVSNPAHESSAASNDCPALPGPMTRKVIMSPLSTLRRSSPSRVPFAR